MNQEKIKNIVEWIICFVIAIIIAVLFRYYLGTTSIVKQTSMYPTLEEGQRVWLSRINITTKTMPERGDIITFEAPTIDKLSYNDIEESVIARYENNRNTWISEFLYSVIGVNKICYIKRVIGLPQEHVVIKEGKVFINDQELEEEYLNDGIATDSGSGECIDLVVPENSVYVMGDNRTGSKDSRYFGCIPLEKIEGKVYIRIYPLNLFGKVE